MRLVPESNVGKIQFYQIRLGPWAEHAAELGLSPAQISELEAKTAAARELMRAQRAAQQAAQAATLAMNLAIEELETVGSNLVRHIRVTAAAAGDGVYSLASIPAPDKPSPVGAPGQPDSFTFELAQVGSLTLRWKCKNPRGAMGTLYQVSRCIGTDGRFQVLGVVGERKFVDQTLPAGAGEVGYQVQALRSTAVGPLARYYIRLGTPGGVGATTASFIPNTTTKTKAALIAA